MCTRHWIFSHLLPPDRDEQYDLGLPTAKLVIHLHGRRRFSARNAGTATVTSSRSSPHVGEHSEDRYPPQAGLQVF
jgi:hypothetical protein